jgi:hypothetical protein
MLTFGQTTIKKTRLASHGILIFGNGPQTFGQLESKSEICRNAWKAYGVGATSETAPERVWMIETLGQVEPMLCPEVDQPCEKHSALHVSMAICEASDESLSSKQEDVRMN